MTSSRCGGSNKSEPTKIAMTPAQQAAEGATKQAALKPKKSECCNDKPATSEKHGCGC